MNYKENKNRQLKGVDFFCGAGGMSYGLARSGIKILAGIDNDPQCETTYLYNNKPAKFILSDIHDLSFNKLANLLNIAQDDDDLIFFGCSPCQYWSKINTDKTRSQKSAYLLEEFRRFIDYFNPGYVVIENVPGLLSHKASILPDFLQFLKSKSYVYDHGVINALFYGVPQNRKRYLLIATRCSNEIQLPKERKNNRLTVRNFIGESNGFPLIEAGHTDTTLFLHTAGRLSQYNMKRILRTPHDGGTRSSWQDDPDLQIPAYKGKNEIFRDVYGRMYWNKPAPTITTRFNSFSNGRFGHPEENRAVSLREGATLQTFPRSYRFLCSNNATIARKIGNAVPPALAKRIGNHLIRLDKNGKV